VGGPACVKVDLDRDLAGRGAGCRADGGGSHNRLAGYVPGNEGARRVVNVARDGGVHAIILDTVVAARVDAALSDQLITMAAGHGRAAGGLHVDFEIPPGAPASLGVLSAKY